MTGLGIHLNKVNLKWELIVGIKCMFIRFTFGLKVVASNKPVDDCTINVNKTTKSQRENYSQLLNE